MLSEERPPEFAVVEERVRGILGSTDVGWVLGSWEVWVVLGHVGVPVSDFERSKRFYAEALVSRASPRVPLAAANGAFVSEEAAIHAGALVAGTITGSHTWGEWVGGSIVGALAIPLAALTTSVAYSRVAKRSRPLEGS